MTQGRRSAADLLRDAADTIERALIQLDMTHERCRCCQTVRFRNKVHAKIYERYTDSATKLRESAKALDEHTSAPSGAIDRRS